MKAGILGGGQLGRMLLQASANYDVETHVLENDPDCPAASFCHFFSKGDITDFETVYQFGKGLDVLTIEIESVNVEALEKLASEGVSIYPSPAAIRIIKNKITQKEFYHAYEIPSPAFRVTENREALRKLADFLPAVHKLGMGGYDGKGVQVIENEEEIELGFDAPSVLEKKVSLQKEIAIIVAMNAAGETILYPPVEMIFDPVLNLLDYQLSPALLTEKMKWKIEAFAIKVVKSLNSPGIFAVELFIDTQDEVWVNETAPRVHNSGHHTIEANYSSQFDMLWRIMLDYPMGNANPIMPASMVNIIGAEGFSGKAVYQGLDEVLKMDNVFVHLYGKKETRAGRKMGHVTIISNDYQDLTHKAHKIKHVLKVTA